MRKPRSPYLKLARLIEDEGFEHREFAKLVGMGESTLSTRLNPKPEQKNNEWRHYEITAICRELHIPQEQIAQFPSRKTPVSSFDGDAHVFIVASS